MSRVEVREVDEDECPICQVYEVRAIMGAIATGEAALCRRHMSEMLVVAVAKSDEALLEQMAGDPEVRDRVRQAFEGDPVFDGG